MARGVNRVILVGRAGKDPETRYMPSGGAVTNISIATEMKWKNKQTGEDCSETEWHNISMFNKLAEIASQYLHKGSLVYIEGRLKTDKWQDKNGNDRSSTKIIAEKFEMLGGKPDGAQPAQQTSAPNYNNASNGGGSMADPMEDDISFGPLGVEHMA